ncbi:hypothetical protein COEREDRAFT_86047 [Coemansia reversa NRRL 1564]|uniref:Uncharacterized protein n=1 Tax=Coemansia reversa (strain ATCC 12441 / NRRL 1564) TaxID=763665 RepID=A0A2G5BEH4_COERN|nr:hypothetical protein COEREDRAFT_86047 [Coemansia reversa NRRL 1564]|eukprot:PIA17415.1 hypothetical protein COEREDRAFT_86047 [Coemansia reversa NRRL 1564]
MEKRIATRLSFKKGNEEEQQQDFPDKHLEESDILDFLNSDGARHDFTGYTWDVSKADETQQIFIEGYTYEAMIYFAELISSTASIGIKSAMGENSGSNAESRYITDQSK